MERKEWVHIKNIRDGIYILEKKETWKIIHFNDRVERYSEGELLENTELSEWFSKNLIKKINDKSESHEFICDYDSGNSIGLNKINWSKNKIKCKISKISEDTKMLELEMIKRNDSSKDKFMAHMHHEIRTPLNGIVGIMELLKGTDLTLEQKEYIELMEQSSTNLMTIINDILDLSKLDADKMNMNIKSCNLHDCLCSAINIVNIKASAKNIVINGPDIKNCPRRIFTDEQRLRQICVNLLNNAIKFTQADKSKKDIEIKVEGKQCNNNTYNIEIKIKDHGIGIKDKDKSNIFEAFRQVDSSLSREHDGTGLGLSICKLLVEKLGGHIGVNSVIGEGSVFYFTINVIKDDKETELKKSISVDLKGKNVIVVDDHLQNRLLLMDLLMNMGIKVTMCSSGQEALIYINNNKKMYDMALVDICMPGMDGVKLAKAIKEINGKIPIIGISSLSDHPQMEDKVNIIHSENKESNTININFNKQSVNLFNDYLIKPIKNKKLIESIEKICSQHDTKKHEKTEERQNIRVIIAEDNLINQIVVGKMLRECGVNDITMVTNGRELLDNLKKNKYDILYLDIKMPVMDGIEAYRRIKEEYKDRIGHTVALTANAMENDRDYYIDMGMDGYLSKPIGSKVLKESIEKYRLGRGN